MRFVIVLTAAFIFLGTGFSFTGAKAGTALDKGMKPDALREVVRQIDDMVSRRDYIMAAKEIDRLWALFQDDKALSKKMSDISSNIDPKVRGILSAINHVQTTSGFSMNGRLVMSLEEKDFLRLKDDSDLSPSISSAIENKNTALVMIFWEGDDKFSHTIFLNGEKPQGYMKRLKDSKEGKRVAIKEQPTDFEKLNRIFYNMKFSFGAMESDDGQLIPSYKILGGL